jgi:hypothetical protein
VLLRGKQEGSISQCHLQMRQSAGVLHLHYGSRVQFERAAIACGESGSLYIICDDLTHFLDGGARSILQHCPLGFAQPLRTRFSRRQV